MSNRKLQQAFGDSHTLDRPTEPHEVEEVFRAGRDAIPYHPLDSQEVRELAHDQGWGC